MKGFIGDWGLFNENGNIVALEPVGVARGGVTGVPTRLSDVGLPLSGKKLGIFVVLLDVCMDIGLERCDLSVRLVGRCLRVLLRLELVEPVELPLPTLMFM